MVILERDNILKVKKMYKSWTIRKLGKSLENKFKN
jgi:hypothetical protein